MRLRFTKGSGKFDQLDVEQHGATVAIIDCPKQGIIPHDMVHFAVEAEIVATGFLGSIAHGGDSGFGAAADDPQARAVERLVETLQAEAWAGTPSADADFLGLYRLTCEARGDTPLALDAATLAAIRARLASLTAQWQALGIGATLALEHDASARLIP